MMQSERKFVRMTVQMKRGERGRVSDEDTSKATSLSSLKTAAMAPTGAIMSEDSFARKMVCFDDPKYKFEVR